MSLLTIIIVGWVVVVPVAVVGGLLAASAVLGRRARRADAVEATRLVHELARLADGTPPGFGPWDVRVTDQRPLPAGY